MNLRHKLCALLLLALWLPYFHHVMEPHCQGVVAEGACDAEHHHEPGHDDHGDHDDSDHQNSDCHQHDPAAPAQAVAAALPPPALGILAAWLELIPEPPLRLDPILPEINARSGPPPPLQTILARAALPVRGPSV